MMCGRYLRICVYSNTKTYFKLVAEYRFFINMGDWRMAAKRI